MRMMFFYFLLIFLTFYEFRESLVDDIKTTSNIIQESISFHDILSYKNLVGIVITNLNGLCTSNCIIQVDPKHYTSSIFQINSKNRLILQRPFRDLIDYFGLGPYYIPLLLNNGLYKVLKLEITPSSISDTSIKCNPLFLGHRETSGWIYQDAPAKSRINNLNHLYLQLDKNCLEKNMLNLKIKSGLDLFMVNYTSVTYDDQNFYKLNVYTSNLLHSKCPLIKNLICEHKLVVEVYHKRTLVESLPIIVKVIFKNKKQPYLDNIQKDFIAPIYSNPGTLIGTIIAQDDDFGYNGQLFFSINYTSIQQANIVVDPLSGNLYTNQFFHKMIQEDIENYQVLIYDQSCTSNFGIGKHETFLYSFNIAVRFSFVRFTQSVPTYFEKNVTKIIDIYDDFKNGSFVFSTGVLNNDVYFTKNAQIDFKSGQNYQYFHYIRLNNIYTLLFKNNYLATANDYKNNGYSSFTFNFTISDIINKLKTTMYVNVIVNIWMSKKCIDVESMPTIENNFKIVSGFGSISTSFVPFETKINNTNKLVCLNNEFFKYLLFDGKGIENFYIPEYGQKINARYPPLVVNSLSSDYKNDYFLIVQVSNNFCNFPFDLTLFQIVKVKIDDKNSKKLLFFSNATYFFDVEENSQPNTYVGTVYLRYAEKDVSINLNKKSSANWNDQISYYIKDSYVKEYFSVDPKTGVVTLKKNVDREQTMEFQFIILGDYTRNNNTLTAQALVQISILDLNDNPPVFTVKKQNITIEHNIGYFYNVYCIQAVDIDDINKFPLRYELTQGSKDLFSVDSILGTLSLVGSLEKYVNQDIDLIIMVTDNNFNDYMDLKISVIKSPNPRPNIEKFVHQIHLTENTLLARVKLNYNKDNLLCKFSLSTPLHFVLFTSVHFNKQLSSCDVTLEKNILSDIKEPLSYTILKKIVNEKYNSFTIDVFDPKNNLIIPASALIKVNVELPSEKKTLYFEKSFYSFKMLPLSSSYLNIDRSKNLYIGKVQAFRFFNDSAKFTYMIEKGNKFTVNKFTYELMIEKNTGKIFIRYNNNISSIPDDLELNFTIKGIHDRYTIDVECSFLITNEIFIEEKSWILDENSPIGTFYQLDKNSKYELISGNILEHFKIKNDQLVVSESPDYETINQYILYILVKNQSSSHELVLTINIKDVDDTEVFYPDQDEGNFILSSPYIEDEEFIFGSLKWYTPDFNKVKMQSILYSVVSDQKNIRIHSTIGLLTYKHDPFQISSSIEFSIKIQEMNKPHNNKVKRLNLIISKGKKTAEKINNQDLVQFYSSGPMDEIRCLLCVDAKNIIELNKNTTAYMEAYEKVDDSFLDMVYIYQDDKGVFKVSKLNKNFEIKSTSDIECTNNNLNSDEHSSDYFIYYGEKVNNMMYLNPYNCSSNNRGKLRYSIKDIYGGSLLFGDEQKLHEIFSIGDDNGIIRLLDFSAKTKQFMVASVSVHLMISINLESSKKNIMKHVVVHFMPEFDSVLGFSFSDVIVVNLNHIVPLQADNILFKPRLIDIRQKIDFYIYYNITNVTIDGIFGDRNLFGIDHENGEIHTLSEFYFYDNCNIEISAYLYTPFNKFVSHTKQNIVISPIFTQSLLYLTKEEQVFTIYAENNIKPYYLCGFISTLYHVPFISNYSCEWLNINTNVPCKHMFYLNAKRELYLNSNIQNILNFPERYYNQIIIELDICKFSEICKKSTIYINLYQKITKLPSFLDCSTGNEPKNLYFDLDYPLDIYNYTKIYIMDKYYNTFECSLSYLGEFKTFETKPINDQTGSFCGLSPLISMSNMRSSLEAFLSINLPSYLSQLNSNQQNIKEDLVYCPKKLLKLVPVSPIHHYENLFYDEMYGFAYVGFDACIFKCLHHFSVPKFKILNFNSEKGFHIDPNTGYLYINEKYKYKNEKIIIFIIEENSNIQHSDVAIYHKIVVVPTPLQNPAFIATKETIEIELPCKHNNEKTLLNLPIYDLSKVILDKNYIFEVEHPKNTENLTIIIKDYKIYTNGKVYYTNSQFGFKVVAYTKINKIKVQEINFLLKCSFKMNNDFTKTYLYLKINRHVLPYTVLLNVSTLLNVDYFSRHFYSYELIEHDDGEKISKYFAVNKDGLMVVTNHLSTYTKENVQIRCFVKNDSLKDYIRIYINIETYKELYTNNYTNYVMEPNNELENNLNKYTIEGDIILNSIFALKGTNNQNAFSQHYFNPFSHDLDINIHNVDFNLIGDKFHYIIKINSSSPIKNCDIFVDIYHTYQNLLLDSFVIIIKSNAEPVDIQRTYRFMITDKRLKKDILLLKIPYSIKKHPEFKSIRLLQESDFFYLNKKLFSLHWKSDFKELPDELNKNIGIFVVISDTNGKETLYRLIIDFRAISVQQTTIINYYSYTTENSFYIDVHQLSQYGIHDIKLKHPNENIIFDIKDKKVFFTQSVVDFEAIVYVLIAKVLTEFNLNMKFNKIVVEKFHYNCSCVPLNIEVVEWNLYGNNKNNDVLGIFNTGKNCKNCQYQLNTIQEDFSLDLETGKLCIKNPFFNPLNYYYNNKLRVSIYNDYKTVNNLEIKLVADPIILLKMLKLKLLTKPVVEAELNLARFEIYIDNMYLLKEHQQYLRIKVYCIEETYQCPFLTWKISENTLLLQYNKRYFPAGTYSIKIEVYHFDCDEPLETFTGLKVIIPEIKQLPILEEKNFILKKNVVESQIIKLKALKSNDINKVSIIVQPQDELFKIENKTDHILLLFQKPLKQSISLNVTLSYINQDSINHEIIYIEVLDTLDIIKPAVKYNINLYKFHFNSKFTTFIDIFELLGTNRIITKSNDYQFSFDGSAFFNVTKDGYINLNNVKTGQYSLIIYLKKQDVKEKFELKIRVYQYDPLVIKNRITVTINSKNLIELNAIKQQLALCYGVSEQNVKISYFSLRKNLVSFSISSKYGTLFSRSKLIYQLKLCTEAKVFKLTEPCLGIYCPNTAICKPIVDNENITYVTYYKESSGMIYSFQDLNEQASCIYNEVKETVIKTTLGLNEKSSVIYSDIEIGHSFLMEFSFITESEDIILMKLHSEFYKMEVILNNALLVNISQGNSFLLLKVDNKHGILNDGRAHYVKLLKKGNLYKLEIDNCKNFKYQLYDYYTRAESYSYHCQDKQYMIEKENTFSDIFMSFEDYTGCIIDLIVHNQKTMTLYKGSEYLNQCNFNKKKCPNCKHGKCDYLTYKCKCEEQWSGLKCDMRMHSFSFIKNGYIQKRISLDQTETHKNHNLIGRSITSCEFYVKFSQYHESSTKILFYESNDDFTEYSYLRIRNHYLEFVNNLGDEEFMVQLDLKILFVFDKPKYFKVIAMRRLNVATLEIKDYTSVSRAIGTARYLNTNEQIFIGNVPKESPHFIEEEKDEYQHCITSIRVYNQDFMNENVERFNATVDCPCSKNNGVLCWGETKCVDGTPPYCSCITLPGSYCGKFESPIPYIGLDMLLILVLILFFVILILIMLLIRCCIHPIMAKNQEKLNLKYKELPKDDADDFVYQDKDFGEFLLMPLEENLGTFHNDWNFEVDKVFKMHLSKINELTSEDNDDCGLRVKIDDYSEE